MPKVTLDKDSFKALASEPRLEILKALDGKKLNLKDLTTLTNLNKATLHVHLSKLLEAGFIKKKERAGHKWVYYKLTWKGESLLHPENSRIVVLFSITFFTLFCGIIQLLNFARGTIVGLASTGSGATTTEIYAANNGGLNILSQSMNLKQVAEVPVHNQTLDQLSYNLNYYGDIKGLAGNNYLDSQFQWNAINSSQSIGFEGPIIPPDASAAVAIVQDPTLLYIGIICFALFIFILGIALWRLWENRTPQL